MEDSGQRKSTKSRLFNLLNLDSLIETMMGYFEKRIELMKIEVKEEASGIGARIMIGAVLAFLIFFIILFASLVLSLLLNHYLNSPFLGHLIVLGFYILILVIILILRKTNNLDEKLELMIYKSITKDQKNGES